MNHKIARLFVFTTLSLTIIPTLAGGIHCGDCEKFVKKINPVKLIPELIGGVGEIIAGGLDAVAKPALTAVGKVLGVAGDVVADGVKAGGKGLGKVVNGAAKVTIKVGDRVMEGPGVIISDMGNMTKEALDAAFDGVDHFAHEFDKHVIKKSARELKNATPYVARLSACMATACLSEVRLHEMKKEAKEQHQKQLEQLKKQYEKASAAEKEKYYKEYLAELNKFKAELEAQQDFYIMQIGYLNYIHVLSTNEIERRKELAFLKQDSITKMSQLFMEDPALGELVMNATPAELNLGEDSIHYMNMVNEYAKAAGIDFQDALTLVMQNLHPHALFDLSSLSLEKIEPTEDKLGLTIIELTAYKLAIEELIKKQTPAPKKK